MRFNLRTLGLALAAIALLALPATAHAVNVKNTFDATVEGWDVISGGVPLNGGFCDGTQATVGHSDGGGEQNGQLVVADDEIPSNPPSDDCLSGVTAPAGFLGDRGDLRANYLGSFSLRVRNIDDPDFGPAIALIDAQGNSVQTPIGENAPPVGWTTYSWALDAAAPYWIFVSAAAQRPATAADFNEVLTDVVQITVVTDLSMDGQGDITHLDDITLAEAPAPADGDGDGVPDASDACPATAGPVANNGCPQSSQPPSDPACDKAKDKLAKAKAKLRKLKTNDAAKAAIKRAKAKVKKAKKKVREECASDRPVVSLAPLAP